MLPKIKYIILFSFLILATALTAQEANYNRWSIELSGGVHAPITPHSGIARSKYIGVKQVQLSARYMFDDRFGLKGHYAFDRFEPRGNSDEGVSFDRFAVEGVANVGKLLNVNYTIRERVGLLFHTGIGISFAKSSEIDNVRNMTTALIGFTGEIKLSNRLSLLGDLTYVSHLRPIYNYNGALLESATSSGGFVNVSVGLIYNIGNKAYHADWY